MNRFSTLPSMVCPKAGPYHRPVNLSEPVGRYAWIHYLSKLSRLCATISVLLTGIFSARASDITQSESGANIGGTGIDGSSKVLPVLNHPLSDLSGNLSMPTTVNLNEAFGTEEIDDQIVRFTSQFAVDGKAMVLDMALFRNRTPITRQNFLKYVTDGDYVNSFIHRSIPGFVIQGGASNIINSSIGSVPTDPPIVNEFGISNTLGTISMAKLDGDPNSATSQWFVSLGANTDNLDHQNGGFTVFGRLTNETLSNALSFGNPDLFPRFNYGGIFTELPLWNTHVSGALQATEFILFPIVELVPLPAGQAAEELTLNYSIVGNSNPAVAAASITGGTLNLVPQPGQSGSTTLTIRATDSVGNAVEDTFIYTVTPSATPVVTTTPVTGVTAHTATLNGTINPNGLAITARFEYGLTTAYGNTASVTLAPDNGVSVQNVSATINGLQPGQTYHYRLTATYSGWVFSGADLTWVTPPSNDATLSSLTVSAGSLSPTFASNITAYTLAVANTVTSTTVTPTVTSSVASVKVNGTAAASGAASAAIPLAVGANVITVEVTAQDGTTKSTYTVTVTRAPAPPSNDATLSSLTVSAGSLSPTFASLTASYTLAVANTVTSTTVTPTVTNTAATVIVNSTTVASGAASESIPLAVGANVIMVEVTAEDGTTNSTYTVTVTRAPAPPSNDATLSSLTVSAGSLSPTFASGTTSYTLTVANTVTSTTVTPTVSNSAAAVKVNSTTVASGAASASIPLVVGANTISVVVTAQNGTTLRTYTITITRKASSNALLEKLVVKGAKLSPKFVAKTMAYNTTVAASQISIQIQAVAADPNAKITIAGMKVKSGKMSKAIKLTKKGKTVVSITVTAQDGLKKTYRVTVTKKPKP
jgi:cyclophilin family peptidyl-prolyl cis-trans isomerase